MKATRVKARVSGSSHTTTYTFGELFCGPGGMSVGARSAAELLGVDLKHKWAVDFDRWAAATYQRNFREAKVLNKNIREVDFGGLERVDGLAFGFPCNDFSLVGEKRGVDGHFGPLYTYCVEAVRQIQPQWFVAENVSGIRSANSGTALEVILEEFNKLDYLLTPHLYRFEDYGVPQRRHRVMIVGVRADLGRRFQVPRAPKVLKSARSAIEDPPIPTSADNHEQTNHPEHIVARLSALQPGQNAFSASLPVEHRLNVRGATISQIYRRLDPDKPSYTVTGSGGGGTHVYHWQEPRALTNRERARLQSFKDDFVFMGGKGAVRRQIGMAVPPDGAKAVFVALFKTMMDLPYDAEQASLGEKYAHLLAKLAEGSDVQPGTESPRRPRVKRRPRKRS